MTPCAVPNDIVKSHGYTIQHCGQLTPLVQGALENIYDVLLLAISDSHYGVDSAPYQAFFKSSYYETIVEKILVYILLGEAIRLDLDKDPIRPQIVCALKNDTVTFSTAHTDIDVYQACTNDPFATVIYYPERSDIFICATFFKLRAQPIPQNCPTVNVATNKFEGNYGAFWLSRMYFLLHELVNFYIGLTLEDRIQASTDEKIDWNYAFSLPADSATYNALNYVLYVASKYIFTSGHWHGKLLSMVRR